METRQIVIFDTSAINWLADDPDSEALIARIVSGFRVTLSFTSISEIIGTSDTLRRQQLLRTCNGLLRRAGQCIDPPNEIVRKMVGNFEAVQSFDWRRVTVRFNWVEREIGRPENFTDELAREEREESRSHDKTFDGLYRDAKVEFDRWAALETSRLPANAREMVTELQSPGGAFWALAGNFYARVAKNPADEASIRKFVAECDPFRALIIAFFVAQYDRCVRQPNAGPSLRAGRNDTQMSIYLPHCNVFVTGDAGQLACYQEILSIGNLDATVVSYADFRERFFLPGFPVRSPTLPKSSEIER